MKKSHVLVGIQFTLIALVVWYCGVRGELWQNVITIAAFALGIWAIATMKFRVNVLPDVRSEQQLYTGGPYRLIRHPMYTAVLSATGAWIFNNFGAISITLWILLLVDLLVKLHYEEGLLKIKFPTYTDYMKKSKQLLPFVY